MKVTFTICRDSWTQYEAEVPDGFDTSDFVAMLELAEDPDTKEVDGDTNLSIFVGDEKI
jgi:hypothetical protein